VAVHEEWRRAGKIFATSVDSPSKSIFTLFFIHCLGIELVLCDLYLTMFDLTKDLLPYTFCIAVFLQIVSL